MTGTGRPAPVRLLTVVRPRPGVGGAARRPARGARPVPADGVAGAGRGARELAGRAGRGRGRAPVSGIVAAVELLGGATRVEQGDVVDITTVLPPEPVRALSSVAAGG